MSKWKIFMMCLMVLTLMAMPLLACGNDGGDEYDLTLAVNGEGSTSPAVGIHTYDDGTVVDITATADSGWEFDGWTGDVADPDSASTTVTMDEGKTVTAKFIETAVSYTLTIAVDGNGTTEPAAGEHVYAEGTVVDITATPNTNNSFNEWTGVVADSTLETTTVTMDADKTITAIFSVEKYPTVTITAPTSGEEVSGLVTVEATITDNKWVKEAGFNIDTLNPADFEFVDMDPIEGGPSVTVTVEWDSTEVANGEHTIYIAARDNLDQGLLGSVTVTVNNQALAASIISPSASEEVSDLITIEATATDVVDIVSGEYSIDGGTAVAMSPDPALPTMSVTFTADWDSTAVSEGDHTITVTVEDTDGLTTTKSVTVTVNNLPPTEWGYEVTYIDDQLMMPSPGGPGWDTNTEVNHWVVTDEGVEHINLTYPDTTTWEGDCQKLVFDFGPNPMILFKGTTMAYLTVQTNYYDVVTGRRMFTQGGISLYGTLTIAADQSLEWTDETHYTMSTVMNPPATPPIDEQHELVDTGTETLVTAAGTYECNIIEDYLIGKETAEDSHVFAPVDPTVLVMTEWWAIDGSGLIKFVNTGYAQPETGILESIVD